MLREAFTHDLRQLQDEILRTGSEVEENLQLVVEAFIDRNHAQAQKLVAADQWMNEQRIDIGMKSLRLIATQQPAAGDMRLLAASFEIIGELERIHDYVKGIGKISHLIGDTPIPDELTALMMPMATKTKRMLHEALKAFSRKDADAARQIPLEDDLVDEAYYRTYQAVIAYVTHNPQMVENANRIEWAAHNLERAADRVTNICEWVVYMATGQFVEMD